MCIMLVSYYFNDHFRHYLFNSHLVIHLNSLSIKIYDHIAGFVYILKFAILAAILDAILHFPARPLF